MITLYTFGPYFGLPDPSPFVIKAMPLLKFAGLEYSEDRGGVASLSSPVFETPLVAAVERQANLIGYRDRIARRYFDG